MRVSVGFFELNENRVLFLFAPSKFGGTRGVSASPCFPWFHFAQKVPETKQEKGDSQERDSGNEERSHVPLRLSLSHCITLGIKKP